MPEESPGPVAAHRLASLLVHHTDAALAVVDLRGPVGVCLRNPRFATLLGPDDEPLLAALRDRALLGTVTSGSRARTTVELPTPGGVRAVELVVVPLPDGSGPAARAAVHATDVTQHRRLEGELQRVRHLLDVATPGAGAGLYDAQRVVEQLEWMSDAYYSVDEDGRFTYVNRQGEVVLQHPRAELLGRNAFDVFPEAVGTPWHKGFARAVRQHRRTTFEAWFAPHERWYEVRVHPLPQGAGIYVNDITERRAAEEERERLLQAEHDARLAAEHAQRALAHQASHDPLTDLLNRAELLRRIDAALQPASPVHSVSLLFVDVDRFKLVNDSLGHAAGDRLLAVLAERLRAVVGPEDVIARFGGDEFVVALFDTAPGAVDALAARVLDAVRAPAHVGGHRLVVTASIGVGTSGRGGDAATLLRDADVALYRAKDAGRDSTAWFDEPTRERLVQRVRLEAELRDAVSSASAHAGQLVLHFQPSFDVAACRAAGVEALVRWQHPERGLVPPADFVPVAEDSGLIEEVGAWVVRAACEQARRWRSEGRDWTVWVNVSPRQLSAPGFASLLRHSLETTGLEARCVGVEVTESALAQTPVVHEELTRVKELGVRVALDDFGTGYSSLARLRTLPVDVLKVDRAFVVDLTTDDGAATVDAIVALGHALGTTVVAEGVETPQQLAALRAAGCDEVAGFLLARPVPGEQVAASAERAKDLLSGTRGG